MGRDKRNEGGEHFCKMVRSVMERPAWRALSPPAQALYPWLKLEWRGPNANNNGSIRFSIRQASQCLGVNPKTAARAFQDLQAKGFIVVTQAARLGLGGNAVGPSYELTEIALPNGDRNGGRTLFADWHEGRDYPVHKAKAQNPRGKNGRTNVVPMRLAE